MFILSRVLAMHCDKLTVARPADWCCMPRRCRWWVCAPSQPAILASVLRASGWCWHFCRLYRPASASSCRRKCMFVLLNVFCVVKYCVHMYVFLCIHIIVYRLFGLLLTQQLLLNEMSGLTSDYESHRKLVYAKLGSIMEDVWARNTKVSPQHLRLSCALRTLFPSPVPLC